MPLLRRALAGGALALLLLAPAAAAQSPPRDCFWGVAEDPDLVNVAYPDEGANYWAGMVALPPGAELVLRGRYPHARYMSFNVYDAAARPTDGLSDVAIEPDDGSSNPFQAGADRNAVERSYTVRVVSGEAPARREPNTIYLGAPAGPIIYRVYVPDDGRDEFGATGLPDASLRLPDGTELDTPRACDVLNTDAPSLLNEAYANSDLAIPTGLLGRASDPLDWRAFFNFFETVGRTLEDTPLEDARALLPQDRSGGFFSNLDNAYVSAFASRGIGPVLVLEGRAPTFPATRDGQAVMGAGQVRYWSICENDQPSTRFIDCLIDEDVAVGPDGRYTVVMSTPGARPANAREECGVNWLRWGAGEEGLLILRHMLPAQDFAEAIQNVPAPDAAAQTMGDYLPTGTHTTTAGFEARGCG